VRKVLGQNEIATVQTTSIDQAAGIVNLTTVLAHSSGEWISGDWPVCGLTETASPRHMGAALTYARRYALFALVGIAGEDDLDAPDLKTPISQTSAERPRSSGNGQLNDSRRHSQERATSRNAKPAPQNSELILGPKVSADLRDRLIAELSEIGSGEEAAKWAHRRIAEKNRLTAPDAHRLEEMFQARLTVITATAAEDAQTKEALPFTAQLPEAKEPDDRTRGKAIDKSELALPEPRRIRDRDHVRFVAMQPCLICGRLPSDAHHLRFAQSRTLGRKVSDEFTVPMCRGHHREVHRTGDEAGWWRNLEVDPTFAGRRLWLETHPLTTSQPRRPVDAPGPGGQGEHRDETLAADTLDQSTT
jgi:hypothetical protein